MARKERATIGVVGLPDAGKTVFHAVLYDSNMPPHRPRVTLSFEGPAIELLEGVIAKLRENKWPDPTADEGLISIQWNLKLLEEETAWIIDTFDAAGELTADLPVSAIEKALEQALRRCDAVLYLLDPGDDDQSSRQVSVLHKVLDTHGRCKPIALVLTKADKYLPDYRSYYESSEDLRATKKSVRDQRKNATGDLVSHLRKEGKKLCHHYDALIKANHLCETFPISCVTTAAGSKPLPEKIAPLWVHEPLFWAVEQIGELRAKARQRKRQRFRERVIVAASLAVFAIFGWGIGYTFADKEYEAAQQWCADHPGPEAADARCQRIEQFLASRPFVRQPFLSGRLLREQRQLAARERKTFLDYHFDKLKADANALYRAGRREDCFTAIQRSFLMNEPAYQAEVANFLTYKQNEEKFDTLKSDADAMCARGDYQGGIAMIQASPLKSNADWAPKVAALADQKKQERIRRNDAELAMLAEFLQRELLNKADTDLQEANFVDPLGKIANSFLRNDRDYSPRLAAWWEKGIERYLSFRYNNLLALVRSQPEHELEALAQLKAIRGTDSPTLAQIRALNPSEPIDWTAAQKPKVVAHFQKATEAAYTFRFQALFAKLDRMSGEALAEERLRLIQSTTWSDLSASWSDQSIPLPASIEAERSRRLALANRESADFDGLKALSRELDALIEPKDAEDGLRVIADYWRRNGSRFAGEIDARREQFEFNRIRYADETKDKSVRERCAAFRKDRPKSSLLAEVNKIDDRAALADLRMIHNDQSIPYEIRIKVHRDYQAEPYARSKAEVKILENELITQWDRADFAPLAKLGEKSGRIESWEAFDSAIRAAEAYLKVTTERRSQRDKVERFLAELKKYDMNGDPNANGVGGLEFRVVEVTLSDAKGLLETELPLVEVFVARQLPMSRRPVFRDAESLARQNYPGFKLRANRFGDSLPFRPGGKFYSGKDRKFQLAVHVHRGSLYPSWSSSDPFEIDFGNAFFASATGTTKFDSAWQVSQGEVKVSVVIEWKGSKLHELYVPQWDK